jgi:hypothetical protein
MPEEGQGVIIFSCKMSLGLFPTIEMEVLPAQGTLNSPDKIKVFHRHK